jgi:hypothetical protein
MVALTLAPAGDRETAIWDDAIDRSVNGTVFHRLDFLAYHGDRFSGRAHHLLLLNGSEAIGRISIVIDEIDGRRKAFSPYGGSYGSFAFSSVPSYKKSQEAVSALLSFISEEGASSCRLTPPISCCAEETLDTFHFCLLEAGFRSVNRDVSSVCVLDGETEQRISSRARNAARKAMSSGVEVVHNADIEEYWTVMEASYIAQGRQPTHSRENLQYLAEQLPGRIWVDVARLNGVAVAGVTYFVINRRVNSSFYLCQDPARASTQSLTLLLLEGLGRSYADGYRYFDFGTSTTSMKARPNIFLFKESFSRSGIFRETFEWCQP